MTQVAKEELKRADHLIHISLKYTRTIDVLLSILQRLVSAMEVEIKDVLEEAKEKGYLKEIQPSPKLRTEQIRKLFKNSEEISNLISFYFFLRTVIKAEHAKKEEFRKNVTMFALDEQGTEFAAVTSETVKEYYKKVDDLINYMDEFSLTLKPKRKK